jgi:hypothetical protein
MNFPIGDHLAGSKHARRVQAAIQESGDDYEGFLQVVGTAWLPLEGEDFNTVLGIFRLRTDANPVEILVFEEPAEFEIEVYIPPPHSSGTMVHDGIGMNPLQCKMIYYKLQKKQKYISTCLKRKDIGIT